MIYLNERPLPDLVAGVFALDGYQSPAVAVRAAVAGANAASVWTSSMTVPLRSITVGVYVDAATLVARTAAVDTVTRACRGLRLFRTTDAPDREMWVELSNVAVTWYDGAFTHTSCRMTLTFTAADPVRVDLEPRLYGLSTARASLPVGTWTSAPTVTLNGASPSVVNPIIIVRNAAGTETHRLTLAGTLATNDALVIDRAGQTIARYVAGVLQTGTASGNAFLTSGVFPILDPSDAIDGTGITMELTATSGTPTGLVLYKRAWA
jgi:hypothetical protein